jgi:hypothetical protein
VDLVGEVADQLGSLGQVGAPDRMAMERFWNTREPRQRAEGVRRELTPSTVCPERQSPMPGIE